MSNNNSIIRKDYIDSIISELNKDINKQKNQYNLGCFYLYPIYYLKYYYTGKIPMNNSIKTSKFNDVILRNDTYKDNEKTLLNLYSANDGIFLLNDTSILPEWFIKTNKNRMIYAAGDGFGKYSDAGDGTVFSQNPEQNVTNNVIKNTKTNIEVYTPFYNVFVCALDDNPVIINNIMYLTQFPGLNIILCLVDNENKNNMTNLSRLFKNSFDLIDTDERRIYPDAQTCNTILKDGGKCKRVPENLKTDFIKIFGNQIKNNNNEPYYNKNLMPLYFQKKSSKQTLVCSKNKTLCSIQGGSKKTKKNIIINNKCLVKKSTLNPLPLSYFKNTGNTIFNNLTENTKKSIKICISILQTFPFCIIDKKNTKIHNSNTHYNFQILKNIFENNLFNKTEKKRRIISSLINMAWQYITTRNADIGVLQTLTPYCEIKTCRPIKAEYKYYKTIHYLN